MILISQSDAAALFTSEAPWWPGSIEGEASLCVIGFDIVYATLAVADTGCLFPRPSLASSGNPYPFLPFALAREFDIDISLIEPTTFVWQSTFMSVDYSAGLGGPEPIDGSSGARGWRVNAWVMSVSNSGLQMLYPPNAYITEMGVFQLWYPPTQGLTVTNTDAPALFTYSTPVDWTGIDVRSTAALRVNISSSEAAWGITNLPSRTVGFGPPQATLVSNAPADILSSATDPRSYGYTPEDAIIFNALIPRSGDIALPNYDGAPNNQATRSAMLSAIDTDISVRRATSNGQPFLGISPITGPGLRAVSLTLSGFVSGPTIQHPPGVTMPNVGYEEGLAVATYDDGPEEIVLTYTYPAGALTQEFPRIIPRLNHTP